MMLADESIIIDPLLPFLGMIQRLQTICGHKDLVCNFPKPIAFRQQSGQGHPSSCRLLEERYWLYPQSIYHKTIRYIVRVEVL